MNSDIASGFLQLISAAVTPVVMISACATLILGINAKHSGVADRIRVAMAELRQSGTAETRRRQIGEQVPIFYRRFLFSWLSLCTLYLAVGVFILTTLTILITKRRMSDSSAAPIVLFICGIVLMMIAVSLEIAETVLANRSLRIEMRDVQAHLDPDRPH